MEALFAAHHPFDMEVIVVDNASGDGSVAMVRRRFSTARIIANRQNLGFAKANNLGIGIAREDTSSC